MNKEKLGFRNEINICQDDIVIIILFCNPGDNILKKKIKTED